LSAVQAQREEYVKTVVDSGHRDIEGMLARLEQEKIVSQRQCADKYEKDSFSQNAERVLALTDPPIPTVMGWGEL
jgi:hypothetical protein